MKPKLIVIEGAGDGIGKTTQYNLIYEELQKKYKVFNHHFPSYNTYHGVPIENYLAGKYGKINELSPYFINSIYANDRAITWYETIKEKYNDDYIILLDRYTTSSLIYQSALIDDIEEKKKFIDWVVDYEYNKLNIPKPDIVIFLTAPFELITKNRNQRLTNDGIDNDIHENDYNFMKKVYDSAIFVANYLSWTIIECSENNKMKSIEDIKDNIQDEINKRFN